MSHINLTSSKEQEFKEKVYILQKNKRKEGKAIIILHLIKPSETPKLKLILKVNISKDTPLNYPLFIRYKMKNI
jgi:hypothetical protein